MKNGLILGSGGARGFAHIGVLKVLDEISFPIHIITGASMGAVIGAVYANGMKAQDIETLVLSMDWKKWFRLADLALPKVGLLKGDRIAGFLRDLIGDVAFEDLKIPFSVTCTNLETGDTVILNSGSVVDAVRASMSVPGAFQPKQVDGAYLVDGGLSEPVPVALAKSMGADQTIAVDVTTNVRALPKKIGDEGFSLYDTLLRSLYIMERRIANFTLMDAKPDLLLKPDHTKIQLFEFYRAKEAIFSGEVCARKHLDELHSLIENTISSPSPEC